MKPIRFLGDSLKCLREFPDYARQDAGYPLDKVQQRQQPDDFKPMPFMGSGVEEIRVWGETGTFRVIFILLVDRRRSMSCMLSKRKHPRRRSVTWTSRRPALPNC
jgi:phage-related protein